MTEKMLTAMKKYQLKIAKETQISDFAAAVCVYMYSGVSLVRYVVGENILRLPNYVCLARTCFG